MATFGDVLGLAFLYKPTQPALSAELPFDAAIGAPDASDVLAWTVTAGSSKDTAPPNGDRDRLWANTSCGGAEIQYQIRNQPEQPTPHFTSLHARSITSPYTRPQLRSRGNGGAPRHILLLNVRTIRNI